MWYKDLKNCKHLVLDLSLGFFHCQFTGLLLSTKLPKLWHRKPCEIIRFTFYVLCMSNLYREFYNANNYLEKHSTSIVENPVLSRPGTLRAISSHLFSSLLIPSRFRADVPCDISHLPSGLPRGTGDYSSRTVNRRGVLMVWVL
jgi:hypothetical protein